jgi:uncharacterized protein
VSRWPRRLPFAASMRRSTSADFRCSRVRNSRFGGRPAGRFFTTMRFSGSGLTSFRRGPEARSRPCWLPNEQERDRPPRINGGAHCRRPAVAGIGNVAGVQGSAMLRDDSGNGGGRPNAPRNVRGDRLEDCSMKPLTGFFRDGCCNTSREDVGGHTVCAVMTAEFLGFSKSCGNDLSTPMPEFGFPGLRPGDRWCLCAPRWQEALEAGQAPRVVLRATHEGALDYCALADLKRFAVDLA